jgi:hypothetical protein
MRSGRSRSLTTMIRIRIRKGSGMVWLSLEPAVDIEGGVAHNRASWPKCPASAQQVAS